MDVRNLIFPMTAGDLVQSAVVLAQVTPSHGLPGIHALEVMNVTLERNDHVKVTFQDKATFEESVITLSASTPLLVTNISRS